jgi:hypothetical protein
MIKDFIPTRTSLSSGLVIKQHLLERNKYPQPQVSYSDESELSGSIDIVEIEGGAAGMFNQFNSESFAPGGINNLSITQSWSVTTPSVSGSVTRIHDSQDEFYNGELSGSRIEVTNGELNPHCEQFKNPAFELFDYKTRIYYEAQGFDKNLFLNVNNKPLQGNIQLFFGQPATSNLAPEIPSSPNPPSSS